jgi:hypothetical protein
MDQLSGLTYKEIESKLTSVCDTISEREKILIQSSGVNTNSVIAGFANGSLSTTTKDEAFSIHLLKQELMSRTGSEMECARKRNIARRTARRLALKINNNSTN